MEIIQDLNKPVDDNSIDTIEMKEPQEQHPANPEPQPQPESSGAPTPNKNEITKNRFFPRILITIVFTFAVLILCSFVIVLLGLDKSTWAKYFIAGFAGSAGLAFYAFIKNKSFKSCNIENNNFNKLLLSSNIILFIGLIVLYILHFTGTGTPSKVNPNASMPVIPEDGQLKVACIDSDTLLAKYQYALDLQEELNKYKESQEKNYQQQVTKFQKDYQTYLQTGENMTLSQQQATEAELKQRSEKLSTLEAELTQKVLQKQMDANIELLNRIFAFVREYNAANQQFDIIMRKTFNDSPTMYMNPAMDITDEIIEGLNEEYKSVKGKKASK